MSRIKLITTALSAAIISGAILGGIRHGTGETLRDIYAEISTAYLSKNISFIESHLDDTFMFHDFGMDIRREAFLKDLKGFLETRELAALSTEVLQVRKDHGLTVATTQTRTFGKEGASGGAAHYSETTCRDEWTFQEGRYRLIKRRVLQTSEGSIPKKSLPDKEIESPRLNEFAESLKKASAQEVESTWEGMVGHSPIIEPIPDAPDHCLVTFIWRGEKSTQAVFLSGGIPAPESEKPLARIPGTNIWFRSERLPTDSRFAYSILTPKRISVPGNGNQAATTTEIMLRGPDPLNPLTFGLGSIAELPAAPLQAWIKPSPGFPRGILKDFTIQSAVLEEQRTVTVYQPPTSGSKKDLNLIILFDGNSDGMPIPVSTIMDNLIGQDAIPPAMTLLVHNLDRESRRRDLGCSKDFADFLALELVPWAERTWPVSRSSKSRVIGGLSLGGLMAAYTAMRHPEVFGNVLTQSGSFWYYPGWIKSPPIHEIETNWLSARFAELPRLPLTFYMEVGRFEKYFNISMPDENRRFRDVLNAKGYDITYREYNGGHDYVTWRNSLAEGLVALLGRFLP